MRTKPPPTTAADQLAQVERDLKDCEERRQRARATGWPVFASVAAYELLDIEVISRARVAWELLDELYRRLQNQHVMVAERVRNEAMYASAGDLAVYQRRHALIQELYLDQTIGSPSKAEALADLMLEHAIDLDEARRRYDNADEEETDDDDHA